MTPKQYPGQSNKDTPWTPFQCGTTITGVVDISCPYLSQVSRAVPIVVPGGALNRQELSPQNTRYQRTLYSAPLLHTFNIDLFKCNRINSTTTKYVYDEFTRTHLRYIWNYLTDDIGCPNKPLAKNTDAISSPIPHSHVIIQNDTEPNIAKFARWCDIICSCLLLPLGVHEPAIRRQLLVDEMTFCARWYVSK